MISKKDEDHSSTVHSYIPPAQEFVTFPETGAAELNFANILKCTCCSLHPKKFKSM